jgi:hypothetical protein
VLLRRGVEANADPSSRTFFQWETESFSFVCLLVLAFRRSLQRREEVVREGPSRLDGPTDVGPLGAGRLGGVIGLGFRLGVEWGRDC